MKWIEKVFWMFMAGAIWWMILRPAWGEGIWWVRLIIVWATALFVALWFWQRFCRMIEEKERYIQPPERREDDVFTVSRG